MCIRDRRFPVTVSDVVMMGRFGQIGWWSQPSKTDKQIVRKSIEQMGITDLAELSIGQLSGGQQQRAFLARALAQEPVSYTHLRAHETVLDIVCRLLLEKKNT